MMTGSPLLDFWTDYDGRVVTLDGIERVIRVTAYMAKYPYERLVVNVHAVPTARGKRTVAYRTIRADLRDDWFTDVLESDFSVQEEILAQL